MTLIVTLELKAKTECEEKLKLLLLDSIPETRAFDGCLSVDIHQACTDAGIFMLYEKWESESKYQEYYEYRSASDAMQAAAPLLAELPRVASYNVLGL